VLAGAVVCLDPMERRVQREAERIEDAYRDRDRQPRASPSGWAERGYRLNMQALEASLLEELVAAGLDPSGRSVLEVGCGTGYFLRRFLEFGARHAAGIDLSADRIARARELGPSLDLVVGDGSRLPWPDESFELVSQFTCLSSVLDVHVREAIAAEMWRVLAPGGAVVSYDMRPTPWPIRAFRKLVAIRPGNTSRAGGTPTAPVTREELCSWFPTGELRWRSVGLDPEIARLAPTRRIAQAGALIPALRVHALAIVQRRHRELP